MNALCNVGITTQANAVQDLILGSAVKPFGTNETGRLHKQFNLHICPCRNLLIGLNCIKNGDKTLHRERVANISNGWSQASPRSCATFTFGEQFDVHTWWCA
mmetsp:Transcript_6822/g.16021  ORF Transcript_6822/g.16021 Transcript_6822/m.16021 type:complete len:102 (+) Transcript_6822:264-569(+)